MSTRMRIPVVARRVSIALALAVIAAAAPVATGATHAFDVLIDLDANASTGCVVATARGSVAGVDRVLHVAVDTTVTAAAVTSAATRDCVAGAFGVPAPLAGTPAPVVLGAGLSATASLELAYPRAAVPAGSRAIRLGVASTAAGGAADALVPLASLALPAGAAAAGPQPIPAAGGLALAMLVLGCAALGMVALRHPRARRATGRVLAILLTVAAAAGTGTDVRPAHAAWHKLFDWSGATPLIVDAKGNAPPNADLVALFARVADDRIEMRIDADVHLETAPNQPPTITNLPPTATVVLPSSGPATLVLAPMVTDDGLPSPPGATTVAWTQVSGPAAAAFSAPSTASTTVSFTAAGVYRLRVNATDGGLATEADVVVTVTAVTGGNQPPVVSAGAGQSIALPMTATLSGSVTDDGLPNPPAHVTATWSVASGPGTGVLFADAHAPSTTATFVAPGTYVLRLTGDDGALSASATATFVVTDGAPTLAALDDRTITLGTQFLLQLQGRDGNVDDVLRYAIVTGPAGARVDGAGLVDWTPTAAQLGRHAFTVSVTDAAGHVASRSFTVEVVKLGQAPVMDAQADAVASIGTTFTRTLHATDADGDVLTYALLAGPPGLGLSGDTLSWNTAGAAPGTSVVSVRVSDGDGLSDVRRFTITLQPAAVPLANDDAYTVAVGATLHVPAAGVLANDVAPGGVAIAAVKRTDPDKGTLTAFGADGSFTFVAPAAMPPPTSLLPRGRWGALVPDDIGFAFAADINHDGGADVIAETFGRPVAFDGKTGALLWNGWDTSPTSRGSSCAMYLSGTDYAMGVVDGTGDITLIAGAQCDASYTAGVSTRLIAVDTNPAHAVAGAAAVKWVSERLDEKLPAAPSVGAPPVLAYAIDTRSDGLASFATPTLARITPGGGVKVLTRTLIRGDSFAFDKDGDGSREAHAGCAAATGRVADEGTACTATFIVDAATGAKEGVLTAPNPGGSTESINREPMRQTAPVVADLDGDGQVEIVSGGDVFRHSGGQWTLAWQATPPADATRLYEAVSVSVADLDGDGRAEVVVQAEWDTAQGRRRGFLIYDANGALIHALAVPTSDAGMPTIADVDGDGVPEIVFAARGIVYAYHGDGTLVWASVIPDDDGTLPGDPPGVAYWPRPVDQRSVAGSSVQVYDLALDGSADVIVNGTYRVVIIDGRTGLTKSSVHSNAVTGNHGIPLVVDTDGDGHAEILSAAGNPGICTGCPGTNIIPFAGEHGDWAPAPRVFNQVSYNPWAIDDAGVIAYDGAVHRSFRQQRAVGTPADPRARSTASFTYAASAASVTSPPATVRVSIVPPNRPPVITSVPPTAVAAIADPVTRQYPNVITTVAAFDPDAGDVVHYALVHPQANPADFPNISIDPASGVLRMWTGACGSYGGPCEWGPTLFIVAAIDSHGARTEQAFTVDISAQLRGVPNVVGLSEAAADAAIVAAGLVPRAIEAFDSHPPGTVVAQDPVAGAPNVVRNATVLITVSKGPRPVTMPFVVGKPLASARGELVGLGLTVDVSTRFSTTVPPNVVMDQSPAFGTLVVPGPATPAALIVSAGPPLTGTIARIVLTPASTSRVTGEDIAYGATAIFGDGTAADVTLGASWLSSSPAVAAVVSPGSVHTLTPGTSTITARVGSVDGTSVVTVAAQAPGDAVAPTAIITAPVDGTAIVAPLAVTGTADDPTLLRWDLAVAPAGTTAYAPLGEGTSPVVAGPLGMLDTTTLENGVYDVRLRVHDRGGNVATARVAVTVDGNRKVGIFTLSYTDLTVPLSGLPIQITRTYDSRDKQAGDFGIGWRIGLKSLRVAPSRELGAGWTVDKSGSTYVLVPGADRFVSVTLPDGKVETFDLQVAPAVSPFVPFATLRASLAPRSGTLGTLTILDNTDLLIVDPQPGPVTLVDDTRLETFHPDRFLYRQRDGTEYVVTRTHGVESIRDASGNQITLGPGGLTHSSGASIVFTRDADGHITAITDPAGHVRSYAYTARGDLASATDRTGNVTRYFYDDRHGLVRIEDPLGRTAARTEYDEAGRVISITDPTGNTTLYRHDLAGREEQVEDALGRITILKYDERGNVTARTDPLGHTTTSTYDARDRVLTRTDPLGHRTSYAYDASDGIASVTDALGRTTTWTRDAAGRPLTETDPRGFVTRWTYDAAGKVASMTDASGNVASYTFDAAGNPIGRTGAGGLAETNAYDAAGRRTTLTDAAGLVTTFAHDAGGGITTQRDAGGVAATVTYDAERRIVGTSRAGVARTITYDAAGMPSGATTSAGRAMAIGTDPAGRLTSIGDPSDGPVMTQDYDAVGNAVAVSDRFGNRTHRTYDAANRLTQVESPGGAIERRRYDAAGRITEIVDARGGTTRYDYDAAGQLVRATDALGGQIRYEYDDAGNRTALVDAAGRRTAYAYDALGRPVRTTYADGTSESVEYDSRGNVSRRVDAGGAATALEYDAAGRLTGVVDALGQRTGHAFGGPLGLLVSTTDANGHATSYAYDASGRRTSTAFATGHVERVEYDAAGRVVRAINGANETVTYDYDTRGRRSRAVLSTGATEDYSYTADGLLASVRDGRGVTTLEYDPVSRRVARVVEPDGRYVRYAYEVGGQRSLMAEGDSAGERITRYGYDVLGRLVSVTAPDGGVTTQSWDAVGNRVAIVRPNGVTTTLAHDVRGRAAVVTHRGAGGAVLLRETYTRDRRGNAIRIERHDGTRADFDYDALGRVVREQRFDAGGARTLDQVFAYDGAGNRIKAGPASAPLTFVFDAANRLVSGGGATFTYDAAGRRTGETWMEGGAPRSVRYRWDALDRLIGFRDSAARDFGYAYDWLGLRQGTNGPSSSARHLLDRASPTGFAQLLRSSGASGSDLFVWGSDLVTSTEGGVSSFPLADALHTVRALTTPAGTLTDAFEHEAFGGELSHVGATTVRHRFTGEQRDAESGLTYLRARYYDPRTGTFLSRDSLAGALDDPLAQNRYLYALGNPVNRRDPGGHESLVEIQVASMESLRVQGTNVLRARRGLQKTEEVLADSARVSGAILGIDAVLEDAAGNPARAIKWFGGGELVGGLTLAVGELGFALEGAINVVAALAMAKTSIDMMTRTGDYIGVQGIGVLLANSGGEAVQLARADASLNNACRRGGLAYATRPNVIELCMPFFTQPFLPTATTLRLPGHASMSGIMLHEYSHLVLGTRDHEYECTPTGSLGLLRSLIPGAALTNADSYRCWAEDTAVGFFAN